MSFSSSHEEQVEHLNVQVSFLPSAFTSQSLRQVLLPKLMMATLRLSCQGATQSCPSFLLRQPLHCAGRGSGSTVDSHSDNCQIWISIQWHGGFYISPENANRHSKLEKGLSYIKKLNSEQLDDTKICLTSCHFLQIQVAVYIFRLRR